MSDHSKDAAETNGIRESVDPRILDGYVGWYRWGEFAVLEVTREGTLLIAQFDGDERRRSTDHLLDRVAALGEGEQRTDREI